MTFNVAYTRSSWSRCASAALLAAMLACQSALAATFTVDSAEDAPDVTAGDGVCATEFGACTLRAAIEEASASAGDAVVRLPVGTYELLPADQQITSLDVATNVKISGAGASQTMIRSTGPGPALVIRRGATATFSGVTVLGGDPAIRNDGVLTLTDAVVRQASDGIENRGTLSVVRSTLHDNGSAGLRNLPGSEATVRNSTVSGNGDGIANEGTLTVRSSTLADNGVGLANDGNAVAGASVFVGEQQEHCTGTLESLGYNVFEDVGECILAAQASDFLQASFYDVGVTPLGNNGGGTPTHALGAGSPAVDRGIPPDLCEATDQRGVPRPQGQSCDAGAYELVADSPIGTITVGRRGKSTFVSCEVTDARGARGLFCELEGFSAGVYDDDECLVDIVRSISRAFKSRRRIRLPVILTRAGRKARRQRPGLPVVIQAYISDGFDVAYRSVALPLPQ